MFLMVNNLVFRWPNTFIFRKFWGTHGGYTHPPWPPCPRVFSSKLLAYHQVSSSSNPIVRFRKSSKSLPFKFCMCFFQCLLDVSVGFSFFMTSEIQLEQLEGENMSIPDSNTLLHYLNVCSYLGASLISCKISSINFQLVIWAPNQPEKLPSRAPPGSPNRHT